MAEKAQDKLVQEPRALHCHHPSRAGEKGAKHRDDREEGKQICAVKTISEGVYQAGRRKAQQRVFPSSSDAQSQSRRRSL